MNLNNIMDLALKLSDLKDIPSDSGIIVDGENIKKVVIGVDMEGPELLLAKELGSDLVISHHPKTGSPYINFHNVMYRQIDKMVEVGVPINKAQKALKDRIAKIERGQHPGNYDRVASFARQMSMPYMNIHLPIDIITENFLQNYLDEGLKDLYRPTLSSVLDLLKQIPEYKNAVTMPAIRAGSTDDYCGKVLVLMAGGTNGGDKVFKAYFDAGIGTIVCMHMPDDVRQAVIEQNIGNVIVAGHMSSDSIGLNIFSKELENKGLSVIKIGGIVE
ncbi:NIF3 (NGG1p interacting factor 3) [Oxobacter pfennigii]|uniref:GTP cyclohydrolase 1 type 2 homolog n=1 Tax=Oxobacter pfennigii TaxID=36849 RepID=A0A0P8Z0T2_9CLOT|nr:hypothetical protein [Oxobacter pfennigii]KPU45751.1 NIF3 (NGG1p interacting factor 3) [Oxobacter pfennigii]